MNVEQDVQLWHNIPCFTQQNIDKVSKNEFHRQIECGRSVEFIATDSYDRQNAH